MGSLLHRNRSILWMLLAILWMAVIYVKSAEPYEVQDVRPKLATIISEERLLQVMPRIEFTYDGDHITYTSPYDYLEFFIRKLGHVTEYGILALLWLNALRGKIKSRSIAMLSASVISLAYAATDEWHQTFVPHRTGHPIDIAVDFLGILIIACAYAVIVLLRKRHAHR